MQHLQSQPILHLVEAWTAHFGWYSKIDLNVSDLSAFTTPGCTLTAHAPLWGVKEGDVRTLPVAEVRVQLARLFRWVRMTPDDLRVAVHPSGESLCLLFHAKARLRILPVTIRNASVAFVVAAVPTDAGLRIDEVHEWSAAEPQEAARILTDQYGWPPNLAFGPYSGLVSTS